MSRGLKFQPSLAGGKIQHVIESGATSPKLFVDPRSPSRTTMSETAPSKTFPELCEVMRQAVAEKPEETEGVVYRDWVLKYHGDAVSGGTFQGGTR
jgi:hypothetical protein